MKKKPTYDSGDVYLEAVRKRRKAERKTKGVSRKRKRFQYIDAASPRGKFNAFMQQDVVFAGSGLIPEGYRGVTYFILFLFLPKITGMLFYFFYVAGGDLNLYNHVHIGGSMLDWVIGYEILATIAILIIGKKLLSFILAK